MTDTPPSSTVRYVEIQQEQVGQRIDNFLLRYLKGVPKSHVYRILRRGEVRVNKGRIKQTYRLQAGDVLRVPPVQTAAETPAPAPSQNLLDILRQRIIYEDQGLLILDKPAGLAVHGGSGIRLGAIEGLRVLYPQARFLELVHRLDRDTSGCLMVAKKPAVLRELHALLRREQHGIHKRYLALVAGHWPEHLTRIDVPLRKNTLQSGERIVRVDPTGKTAQSRFRIRERFGAATLLAVELLTGRTHQIRVHTAHAGHPVAGDEKYGDEAFNHRCKTRGLNRLFLHAESLEIQWAEKPPTSVQAPLPAELAQFLRNEN